MLELKNIYKDYLSGDSTVHALQGVDIRFRESEFVAILGPSGCGKTTLLNIIGGLDGYTSGDLVINGRSTKDYKDSDWDAYRNHSIGFVFQSYNLIPHLSVLANVELALTLSGVSRAERRSRAIAALERVGLSDQLRKKPNQLSGGQMQRVAIARALVGDPEILLADEPTGALDSETSLQIMDILKEIADEKLVIMVTHNPDLAEQYATRTVRLLDGRILSDTDPCGEEPVPAEPAVRRSRRAKERRPSMSSFTAFSLSLRNLLTKKARTILTAFAGSIGIIGIALILSLSSGLQNYIDRVEEDTLSSYPITIQRETVDFGSMMTAMMGRNSSGEHEDDRVYSNDIMSGMMDSMISEINRNDLASFKAFLEDPANGIQDLVSGISYSYSTPLNIYRQTADGSVLKANPADLFDSMYSAMGMQMNVTGAAATMRTGFASNTDVWSELIDNREILESQYDVITGRFPERWDEVVVVIDEHNEISDYALYTMGLRDRHEIEEIINAAVKGEELPGVRSSNHSYEEFMALRFRLVPSSAFYEKQSDGTWKDRSDDDLYLSTLLQGLDEIKVVGILRPSEDAVTTSVDGSIGYLPGLMEHLIDQVNESEIVKQQLADPDTDVMTGLPFEPEEPEPFTAETFAAFLAEAPEDQQQMIQGYISQMKQNGMSDEEILAFFSEQRKQAGSDSTYSGNLAALGVASIDDPSLIKIFPKDFDSKEAVVQKISDYNDDVGEESAIKYTDYVGILMSSVTTIINAISYILIAFVSISLVVSSIMIGIITYISVLERTKEIGILRAMGASKRDIARVFNAEAMIIGLTAGLLGIGVTILLCIPANAIIKNLTGISGVAQLPPVGGVVLVVISVLLTLVAGLMPSRIAAKKDPAVALRTE